MRIGPVRLNAEQLSVRAFAALVIGDEPVARAAMEALGAAAAGRAFAERVLMVHLFAGFPRQIVALQTWRNVLEEQRHPAPSLREAPPSDPSAGRATFDAIYGDVAPIVLERLRALAPILPRLILDHAYGRILARPGLSVRDRELASVGALAVTDTPEQLQSHIRGAIRNGASHEAVLATIAAVSDLIPERAQSAVDGVRAQLQRDLQESAS